MNDLQASHMIAIKCTLRSTSTQVFSLLRDKTGKSIYPELFFNIELSLCTELSRYRVKSKFYQQNNEYLFDDDFDTALSDDIY